jgi:hypothetical protein
MQKQHKDCHKPGHLFLSIAAHTFAFATTKHNPNPARVFRRVNLKQPT